MEDVSVAVLALLVGFAIGSTAMVALGVSWSWLIAFGGLVGGLVSQLQHADRIAPTVRGQWSTDPGPNAGR